MSTPDREFKDAIYEQLARIGRAVDHPRRLELLDLLCQGPMTVEQLAAKSSMPLASASQHLQQLREARMVQAQRHGSHVVYRLADEHVCDFFVALRDLAQRRYSEIKAVSEEFLADLQALEAVDGTRLQNRVNSGEVVLLDVRPPEEYATGHWPGAWSVPLDTLASRLRDLPRDRTIVAYCRGPYCVLAPHAVKRLREAGFQAIRLAEGPGDWRTKGLALAVGDRPSDDPRPPLLPSDGE